VNGPKVTLVLPAAGKASRLKSIKPKPLLEIAKKPLVQWIYERVNSIFDIESVIIIANSANQIQLREWLVKSKIAAEVLVDDSFRGSAHAVKVSLEGIATEFVVVAWPDHIGITKVDSKPLIPLGNVDYVMPVVKRRSPYAELVFDKGIFSGLKVHRDLEKRPDFGLSDCGLFCWKSQALREFLLSPIQWKSDVNLLSLMAEDAGRLIKGSFPLQSDWRSSVGINSIEELQSANELFEFESFVEEEK
jgi:molybdopterin-guanine dinucleotide biosynthesis protein A